MCVAYILVSGCLVAFAYLRLRKSRAQRFAESIKHPIVLPIIGNFWYLAKADDRLSNILKLQRDYGNRVTLMGGGLSLLILFHPDDVKKVLSSKECMSKGWSYQSVLSDWLGSTLFFTTGKQYFEQRKMTKPALDSNLIDNFSLSFNKHTQALVDILKANAVKGVVTDINWLLTSCTLDTIFEYLVGRNISCLNSVKNEYAVATHDETESVFERGVSPWLWPSILWRFSSVGRNERRSRKILHDFMDKIVRVRKAELSATENGEEMEGNKLHGDRRKLLDLLLHEQRNGRGLTDEYIRDETNFFVFAGHDTITSCLTWTIFLLASNPKEQEKLYTELMQVFADDRNRNVEPSDLPRMKYLDCCIREALRLHPPVPVFLREILEDFELDDATIIPKGMQLALSPWVTHRLPEFFPEPEEFRPSRFFTENSREMHPYSYFPFSGGHRSCMGQRFAFAEAKTVLAHIFRNFVVELACPAEKVIPMMHLVVAPKDGLKVRLKLR